MRDPRARTVATATLKAIETLASDVARLPSAARLADAAVQARVVDAVTQSLSGQLTLEGTTGLDVAAIVAATCAEVARGTIDIPRV